MASNMQLFWPANILNLFCMIINDGVKSMVGRCVYFGGFISIPFWCVCFGFVLVVFLSITAAVIGLGVTEDLPYYATIILVQSKTKDPAPKADREHSQLKL